MNTVQLISPAKRRMAILAAAIALSFSLIPNSAEAVEAPLNLGTASTYGVLASSTITNAAASTVSGTAGGDIGIGGATAATGPITYSGAQVLGGASLIALTSASIALSDVRTSTALLVELGAGKVITPGAYSGGTFEINGAMTLDAQGDSNAVFIFRTASTLVTAVGSSVLLINGAQACNVYWQVGSAATLGVSSTFAGHLIANTLISTGLNSTISGQLISITDAVTLGGSTIINNSCTSAPVVVTPTPTPIAVVIPVLPVETATLHVVKEVINKFGGTRAVGSFIMHVTQGGREVEGSPAVAMADPGTTYILPVGEYLLFEDDVLNYRGVWSGLITNGGRVNLEKGMNITVTRTNYDMFVASAVPTPTPTPVVTPTPTPTPVVPPTETPAAGEILPNTSTAWGNEALFGFALITLGLLGFRSRKLISK